MNRMGDDRRPDFEDWLSRQVRIALDLERGLRPRPDQARYQASRRTGVDLMAIRSSIIGALGVKAAVGGAVVALAAGAAGTASTGSVNPVSWGQHVAETVEQCKQEIGVRSRGGSGSARDSVG